MGEEELKKEMVALLKEIRIETPAIDDVVFSDPCPCCNNKKRRCLLPSTTPRKKVLVFGITDGGGNGSTLLPRSSPSPSPSPSPPFQSAFPSLPPISTTSSPSLSPLPLDSGGSSFGFRSSAPTPTSTAPPLTPSSDALLVERSDSSFMAPIVCSSKVEVEAPKGEEIRVSIRCGCGIFREIVLIR